MDRIFFAISGSENVGTSWSNINNN